MSNPKRLFQYAVLAGSAFIVGALIQLAFAVVRPAGLAELERQVAKGRAGARSEPPVLRGTKTGVSVQPSASQADSVGSSGAGGRSAARTSVPPAHAALYREIVPRAFQRMTAPVGLRPLMYGPTEDLPLLDESAGSHVELVLALEDAARRAVQRRGVIRLPASEYLVLGIPGWAGRYELVFGDLPLLDEGEPHFVLRGLSERAGLGAESFRKGTPKYAKALGQATSYMRERFAHRLNEQRVLASFLQGNRPSEDGVGGGLFLVSSTGTELCVVGHGVDGELDRILAEYARAPAVLRAKLAEVLSR